MTKKEQSSIQLKVASNTNVQTHADAIVHNIRQGKIVEVVAVGAGAVNQAVKGQIVARRIAVSEGIELNFRPAFATIQVIDKDSGEPREITGIKWLVLKG